MSKAAELAALIGSQTALSNRNLIINGAMQVDQRNTTTTATGYALDRYYCAKENFDEAVIAITQDTDSPDSFSNSLKYAVTTAESSLASDEIMYISQKIEAQNLQHLNFGSSAAKSITLSFFVKSSLTGKYSVLMYSDDAVRSNLQSYTINSANTWEKKTITFDGDTAGSGINNDNGTGLWLFFTLAAGSDYTGTPHTGWGAYNATDDFAHSDAVNFAAQTGEFFITGVQLEAGDVATPFEHRSFADELAGCQRYFLLPYGDTDNLNYALQGPLDAQIWWLIWHPVKMRVEPTYTFYGGTNKTQSGKAYDATGADYESIQAGNYGHDGMYSFFIHQPGTANSNYGVYRVELDAEL